MAVAFRAATTVETTGTTAAVSNVPTGTVDGDLLIWQVGTAGTNSVQATPTGWTLAKSLAGPSGLSSIVIWYRVAASEPASYTTGAFTGAGRRTAIMSSYSGVDNITPLDVAVPTITEGTTAVACPAITPVTAGAWVLGLASVVVASGVINTTYSSSNLTAIDSQVTSTQGAATNNVEATGHFAWTSGAFTPAYTTSNASTRSIGVSLALRPARSFPANQVRRVMRPPMARRRGRVEVAPSQADVLAAPAKVSETGRHARLAALASRRRRPAEVVPPQIVVTPPTYVPAAGRPRRGFFASRRGRSVEVVPPQIAQPPHIASTRRRVVRALVVPRRRSRVEVVPPQIVVTPPTSVPDTRRRPPRGFMGRRRRPVEVTPPQVVVTPPSYVPAVPPKHVLRGVPRRGRRADVVPAQAAAPVAPPYVPAIPPKHVLRGTPRRGRQATVPHPQAHAHRGQPRRPIRGLIRRVGHAVGVLTGISGIAPLQPGSEEGVLTAAVYSATLTAPVYGATLTASTAGNTLTAQVAGNTLTAATYSATLKET